MPFRNRLILQKGKAAKLETRNMLNILKMCLKFLSEHGKQENTKYDKEIMFLNFKG